MNKNAINDLDCERERMLCLRKFGSRMIFISIAKSITTSSDSRKYLPTIHRMCYRNVLGGQH